ncbi:MAG: hypothetical protein AB7W47_10060 [Calditrichaceae bacterium]
MNIYRLFRGQITKNLIPLIMGVVSIFVFTMSCADQITSDSADENLIVNASFPDIQDKVFSPTCAVSGCHVSVMHESGMNLSAGAAYENLVDVVSRGNPQLKRVEPGNSQQSYLIRKLTGNNTAVMPPAGKLNSSVIDSIAAWIDAGALP